MRSGSDTISDIATSDHEMQIYIVCVLAHLQHIYSFIILIRHLW